MVQTKTIENLIINELSNPASVKSSLSLAFEGMRSFFSSYDFLYNTNHSETISLIYDKRYYRYCEEKKLSLDLHIDNKVLLRRRKLYIALLWKFYYRIPNGAELDIDAIFDDLYKEFKR